MKKFKVASIAFDDQKFSNKREMEIFENLNSKGMELNLRDLMKNNIFSCYCDDNLLNNNERAIANEYEAVISSSKIDDGLEDFYSMSSELVNGRETPKNKREQFNFVKKSIQTLLPKEMTADTLDKWKKIMKEFKNYLMIFNETKKAKSISFLKFLDVEKIVLIFDDYKKRRLFSHYLVLLFLLIKETKKQEFDFDLDYDQQDIALTKDEIKKIQELFLEIAKFVIRKKVDTLQGDSSTKRSLFEIAHKRYLGKYKNISEFCDYIINDINVLSQKEVPFQVFKTKLETNNEHRQARELLILTELTMMDFLQSKEVIHRDQNTLEHILPQDYKLWLDEINDESKKEEFQSLVGSYIDKLGNYIILSKSLNSKAKNKVFNEKKIKEYPNICSKLFANENEEIDVSRKLKWTFEEIDKRTKALINYITTKVITK